MTENRRALQSSRNQATQSWRTATVTLLPMGGDSPNGQS
jgi:hypothetical protein